MYAQTTGSQSANRPGEANPSGTSPSSRGSAIERLLKGIDIPPCPEILGALLAESRADVPDQARIGRLISRDVALSAGVLKVANSDLFLPARQVATVSEALAMLGVGRVFQWLINALLNEALSAGQGPRFERFWDTAARTAAVCARLSIAYPGVSRDNAYDFGLFRDCGIPLMSRRFPEYGETLQRANVASTQSFTRVEEARHGTHHAVVGSLMARNWGLSGAVSDAILWHHDYAVLEGGSGLSREALTLVALNVIAEQVLALHQARSVNHEWLKGRDAAAEYLGLGRAGISDLVDDLRMQIERRRASL